MVTQSVRTAIVCSLFSKQISPIYLLLLNLERYSKGIHLLPKYAGFPECDEPKKKRS